MRYKKKRINNSLFWIHVYIHSDSVLLLLLWMMIKMCMFCLFVWLVGCIIFLLCFVWWWKRWIYGRRKQTIANERKRRRRRRKKKTNSDRHWVSELSIESEMNRISVFRFFRYNSCHYYRINKKQGKNCFPLLILLSSSSSS